jgi:hypothetical protein
MRKMELAVSYYHPRIMPVNFPSSYLSHSLPQPYHMEDSLQNQSTTHLFSYVAL